MSSDEGGWGTGERLYGKGGGESCGRDCDCLEVLKIVLLLISIPTVLTAERLSNYKSRIYHIKTL